MIAQYVSQVNFLRNPFIFHKTITEHLVLKKEKKVVLDHIPISEISNLKLRNSCLVIYFAFNEDLFLFNCTHIISNEVDLISFYSHLTLDKLLNLF